MFTTLVEYLKSTSGHFENWKPCTGYSLLHGDLHIGNIVKKDNNYLLVDFEYLRYGAAELETANLIISSLIWHHKRNANDGELKSLITDYFRICGEFTSLYYTLFKFFFIFSLSLYYLSTFLKKDEVGLATIRKIIRLNSIVGDDKHD